MEGSKGVRARVYVYVREGALVCECVLFGVKNSSQTTWSIFFNIGGEVPQGQPLCLADMGLVN